MIFENFPETIIVEIPTEEKARVVDHFEAHRFEKYGLLSFGFTTFTLVDIDEIDFNGPLKINYN